MKAIHLILFLIFFSSFVYSQTYQIDSVVVSHCRDNTQNNSINVDSFDVNGLLRNTTVYFTDTIGIPGDQIVYTYSGTNKLIQKMRSNYVNFVWKRGEEENWQFDSLDNLTYYAILYFNLDGLISYARAEFYSYDSLGRRVEYIQQKFNYTLQLFENDIQVFYSYDTVLHSTTFINQKYDETLGLWENNYRQIIFYNSLGQESRHIVESWVDPGNYVKTSDLKYYYLPNDSLDFISNLSSSGDSSVTKYIYDNSGYVVKILSSVWASGSSISTTDSTNYFYDINHNQIGSSYYNDNFMGLLGCDTASYTYDSSDRLIGFYNSAMGICGRGGQSGWTAFNSLGLIDSSNNCTWTMGTIACQTCSFQYISLVSGISSLTNNNEFNIFPNPAESEITISIKQNVKPLKFIIYDNLGRPIKTGKINFEVSNISISELPSGIYYILIKEVSLIPVRIIKV